MKSERPRVINLEDEILDDSKKKYPKKKRSVMVK
jgi:hypothetical protein